MVVGPHTGVDFGQEYVLNGCLEGCVKRQEWSSVISTHHRCGCPEGVFLGQIT
jgi:hypothetical protein